MLIDTHRHLDFPDFEAERDDIVARAHAAGVKQMITISTRVRKFPAILAIADQVGDAWRVLRRRALSRAGESQAKKSGQQAEPGPVYRTPHV